MSPIGVCSSMRNMLPLICAWTPRPSKGRDRKSTRLNSSHLVISYAVFCLKKKKNHKPDALPQDFTQLYVFCPLPINKRVRLQVHLTRLREYKPLYDVIAFDATAPTCPASA